MPKQTSVSPDAAEAAVTDPVVDPLAARVDALERAVKRHGIEVEAIRPAADTEVTE
jgi:hypothetical protein